MRMQHGFDCRCPGCQYRNGERMDAMLARSPLDIVDSARNHLCRAEFCCMFAFGILQRTAQEMRGHRLTEPRSLPNCLNSGLSHFGGASDRF